MGSSLSSIALKGVGALLVALIVLSVVGTVVGLVVGFVMTVVMLAVATAAVALFLGFAAWLASTMLAGGGTTAGGVDDRRVSSDRIADGAGSDSRSWRDWLPGGNDASGDDRDEADRLRDRYVAGEIDEAEFERRLALLLETSDVTESQTDRRTGASSRDDSIRDRLWE